MNIRDLKYFVALLEHKHFGKAAEACFVSQPTLSMQIKKLEEYLGVKLLERTNKSVMLTEIGYKLADQAQQILHQVNCLRETAKLNKDPYSGELKLGIIPTLAPYLLPHIMPKLTAQFSNLTIFLIEEQTAHLVEKLKAGKLDAAILALPILDKDFKTFNLFEEEFVLAVPNAHPLTRYKTVTVKDLKNYPLLLLEEGHCLREQALAVCQTRRRNNTEEPKANEIENFRATSLETLRHMVESGVGITLLPKLACRSQNKTSYISFQSPKPHRKIGLVTRGTTTRAELLSEMGELIKKLLRKNDSVQVMQS